MQHLAQKLIYLRSKEIKDSSVSVIFGSAGSMGRNLEQRAPVRIGFWPIISDDPRLSMGIASALALLLERWAGIIVYRLFARLEGDSQSYEWTLSQSQFDVDDWQLDGLDENVAIWGALTTTPSGVLLKLNIENDLADVDVSESEVIEREYQADNLGGLITMLPKIAVDVAQEVKVDSLVSAMSFEQTGEGHIRPLLSDLFDWDLQLLLALWGKSWAEATIGDQHRRMVEAAKSAGRDWCAWAAASATAYAMQPGFGPVAEALIPLSLEMMETLEYNAVAATVIAPALFNHGAVQEAFDTLDYALESNPRSASAWSALAALYRRSGRFADAVEAIQAAIKQDVADAATYIRYADLLYRLDQEDWSIEEVLLCDPAKAGRNPLKWEIVEALEHALRLDPDRPQILQLQLLRLIQLDTAERLWERFRQLVLLDKETTLLRSVVDALYEVRDVRPGIAILEDQCKKAPDRVDLLINLASLYLFAEDEDKALTVLQEAEDLTDDAGYLADIGRLMLSAEDPDFEMNIAELADVVGAGNALEVSDVDYLEEIAERVPTLTEAYIILAKAYLIWGEESTALEVLLDGQKHLPDDPELIEQLARILWDTGEQALALDYLDKGVQSNPDAVALLALSGQYLFEDGQTEAARALLSRAESLAPRHPVLEEVKQKIARLMAGSGDSSQ